MSSEIRAQPVLPVKKLLPLDSRFAGSNPAEAMAKAMKIHSTPSSGGEVKPSAHCRLILRHVKDHFEV
jgi:hypothetical protein